MIKRGRALLPGMLWLSLAVLLFVAGMGALEMRTYLFGDVHVRNRLQGTQATSDDLTKLRDEMAENPSGSVAGYAQALSSTIACDITSASTNADVLYVDGDASLIWNVDSTRGALPVFSGGADCALEEQTALLLFGSLDVIGEPVDIGGREMTVRGVFRLPEGLPNLGTNPGRGLAFADFSEAPTGTSIGRLCFAVHSSGALSAEEKVREWMNAVSLSTGDLEADVDLPKLLTFLTSLPAYLLLMMIAISLLLCLSRKAGQTIVQVRALRIDPFTTPRDTVRVLWRFLLSAGLMGAMIACALYLSPGLPSVPPSYLPTRWSDFSFYTDKFDTAMENIALRAFTVSVRPDLPRLSLTRFAMFLPLASLFALLRAGILLLRGMRGITAFRLSVCGVISLLLPPASLLITSLLGLLPTATVGLSLLPALFVLTLAYTQNARTADGLPPHA